MAMQTILNDKDSMFAIGVAVFFVGFVLLVGYETAKVLLDRVE
jgi:hypothetical protein